MTVNDSSIVDYRRVRDCEDDYFCSVRDRSMWEGVTKVTLEEAKKTLRMTVKYKDEDPALLHDEIDALNTVLDYLDEGLPGRTVHELKLGWNFCDPVLSGRKSFELRKNDRGFQTGDLIRFVPVRFEATETAERYPYHPVNDRLYEITYMLNGWGLNPDCVALGIKEVEK